MNLKDQMTHESDERVVAVIRALLVLTDYRAFESATVHDMLHVAGNRLAAAAARIAELQAENAALSLGKINPPAPDGLKIVRDDTKENWQWYNIHTAGGTAHYSAIKVVRRMSGKEQDDPAFALIERRLLAGNPGA